MRRGVRARAALLLMLAGATMVPVARADGVDRACGQPLVRMLLSPRMPYALLEWRRMRQAAEDAGFEVRAERDPRVPDAEWQAAVQALGLAELAGAPVLDEPTAAALGLLHHAPSSLVERCGRRHPWPVLGVMPDAAWRALLRQRLAALE